MGKVGQLDLPRVRKRPAKNGGRWGGRREGAGRKPAGAKAGVPHQRRRAPSKKKPMHLTVRLLPGLRRLRQRHGYQIVRGAIAVANRFGGAWICEVSIQHNHIHLIAETTSQAALTRMMRSFGNSVAKMVNAHASRRGRVIDDRYHSVILRTPAQVRAAIAYVLGNWRRHGEDLRIAGPRRLADRYSTGPGFTGWDTGPPTGEIPFPDDGPLPVQPPRSWLLRAGWRKLGLISPWARPGPSGAATLR